MDKKLNIAMICDPIGEYKAGAIVSAVRFSKLLEARGHHIIFIGAKTKEYPNHFDNVRGINTYRYRSIPLPKSGGWHLAFPTVSEIKQIFIKEKINIIHIILPMPGAIVAIKAAQSLGLKIVAHSHSQPENLFMDMPTFLRPVLDKTWNSFLAWVYSKGEVIVYPSKMAYDLLNHLTNKNKKSVVLSNGVNTLEFKPSPTGNFHERFNIPKNKLIVAYVGRLFPEKSVHTLIEAAPEILKKHKDTHFMIIGGGYLREKLEKLTIETGMSAHISFLGQVSDEDKTHAYNACDIFASPSFAELEGMTVLEAMACAKPVVIPDCEMNAARYFVKNNGLLFETSNKNDLAEKITAILIDDDLRKNMGEASLQLSKKYDIHESAITLENIYHTALNHNSQ